MTDDFNIIYPPLVEQAFEFIQKVTGGKGISKPELYKKLVNEGLLDKNGNPTKMALEQGLVEENKVLEPVAPEIVEIAKQVLPEEYIKITPEGNFYISFDAIEYLDNLLNKPELDSDTADKAEKLIKWIMLNRNLDVTDPRFSEYIASEKLKVVKDKDILAKLLPCIDSSFIEGRIPSKNGYDIEGIVICYKEALIAYEDAYNRAPNAEYKAFAKMVLDILKQLA